MTDLIAGHSLLESEADLRSVYRAPSRRSLDKQLDHLEDHCRAFLAHAPLAMLATVDASGNCDVSPKGGPAGFARVLDDHTVAIGDLAGNNRLDSFKNIVESDGVGLLFLIPGRDETLRINGRARISVDPAVLEACALEGVPAFSAAIVVDVREAFIHCAKAIRRSGAWTPEAWPDTSDLASNACMIRDHANLEASEEEVAATLEDAYEKTIWETGGERG